MAVQESDPKIQRVRLKYVESLTGVNSKPAIIQSKSREIRQQASSLIIECGHTSVQCPLNTISSSYYYQSALGIPNLLPF